MFFYYQNEGGEEAWHEALLAKKEDLIATKKPRYATVLGLVPLVSNDMTREELDAIKYKGPFYVDWDAESLDTAIEQFQKFLRNLEKEDINLNSLYLYASGGRGFHLEMPQEIFLEKKKIPATGMTHLPAIYKEMVYGCYVDTIDLRVYTARRGRMWRVMNVQRENGKFKVPITVEEAFDMTPELYADLVAAPRTIAPRANPEMNNAWGVRFAKAEAAVRDGLKKRAKSSKDAELLARFNGEVPASIQTLMNGDHVKDGTGFHSIAMQIAIVCTALGKTADEMLALCEGLIKKHESDGFRYNSPAKRRNELVRMYQYVEGNPCYSYNKGAIKVLLTKEVNTLDLDGGNESTGEVIEEGDPEDDQGMLGGVFMTDRGVFRRSTEHGVLRLSDVGFRDAVVLQSAASANVIGFEAEVLSVGKSRGRQVIDMQDFTSRAKYLPFCMKNMGVTQTNDAQVTSIAALLRDNAVKNKKVTYLVSREGLDFVQRPDTTEDILDAIWVGSDGVFSHDQQVEYRHRGSPSPEGTYKSDLMLAPAFENTEHMRKVVHCMLNLNTDYAIGCMLGWSVAAFMRQMYQRVFGQFPLLHPFGQSGSGKTTISELMAHLFYYRSPPLILQVSSVATTQFAITTAITASASIPLVLEEYQPRSMPTKRHPFLLDIFKNAWNMGTYSKGGMNTEIGGSFRDIRTFSLSAPLIYIGEAKETHTAVSERTIAVPLQKANLVGRREYADFLTEYDMDIGVLGKLIAHNAMSVSLEGFKEFAKERLAEAREAFPKASNRPQYSMSVVLTGLDFLAEVLRQAVGTEFDERIAQIRNAVIEENRDFSQSHVMAEAAKVLNILSLMSRTEEPDSEFGLRFGREFVVHSNGDLELKMRECFFKYVAWARRKGQMPLYDDEQSFIIGLMHYGPVKDRMCATSPLKDSGLTKVFRFSGSELTEEGVEEFATIE
jgi:hypothetical protein